MDSNRLSRGDTVFALAGLLFQAAGLILAARDRSRPRIILGLVGLGLAVRSVQRAGVQGGAYFGIAVGLKPENSG